MAVGPVNGPLSLPPSTWTCKFFSSLFFAIGGFPGGASGKEPTCYCRDAGSIPGSEEDPLG